VPDFSAARDVAQWDDRKPSGPSGSQMLGHLAELYVANEIGRHGWTLDQAHGAVDFVCSNPSGKILRIEVKAARSRPGHELRFRTASIEHADVVVLVEMNESGAPLRTWVAPQKELRARDHAGLISTQALEPFRDGWAAALDH